MGIEWSYTHDGMEYWWGDLGTIGGSSEPLVGDCMVDEVMMIQPSDLQRLLGNTPKQMVVPS